MKIVLLIICATLFFIVIACEGKTRAAAIRESDTAVGFIDSVHGTYLRDGGTIHRWHDDELMVTCWIVHNESIFCLADHELE